MNSSAPSQTAVLSLEDLTVVRGGATLLDSVSWSVEPEQRWVILGPNGAGKTTLLRVAAAQLHPSAGAAHVLGERLGGVDVFELRPRIGFSSPHLAERIPPSESVLNAVVTSAYAVLGRSAEEYDTLDELRARALLAQLGVLALAERRYSTLSDGERKRVHIARALMTNPELLLLDEPAAGLDVGAREDLLARLARLAHDAAAPTLVLVTHHVEEIPPGISHALLLRSGRIVAAGPLGETLTNANLTTTFELPLALHRDGGRFYARAA